MHKWLGIVHSDSEDDSSDDEKDLFTMDSNEAKQTRAKEYADIIASRAWGLSHRDKAGLTEGSLALTKDVHVVFQEELGQQRRVWDCALVLSKCLTNTKYFPENYFEGKNVIELGCGIGVPGLSAALLGAKQVVLTDMDIAIPWIELNIAKNNLQDRVTAMPLMWGPHVAESNVGGPFDVIICSDLIYGDVELAQLLMETIQILSHKSTQIVFAHEARFAGNQGKFFFDTMKTTHDVIAIPFDNMDTTYRSPNIHVHLINTLSN